MTLTYAGLLSHNYCQKNDKKIIANNQPKILIEPILSVNGVTKLAMSYKTPLHVDNNKKAIGVIGASFMLDNENAELPFFSQDKFKTPHSSFKKNVVLTNRQMDCLYYLIQGRTTKEIAKQLNLAPKTIEHYLNTVKIKLGCHSRTDLIVKGLDLLSIKKRLILDKISKFQI